MGDIMDTVDTMDTPMPAMDILASALLMLSLRPRLMLTPTFCMEDMDTLDMLDMDMDTPMPTMDILASVLLMLRLRLMLILTFSIEDMDILAMQDTMDTPMPTMDIMASVLLMLSPRLMLTPTFSMEDMDMDTLDMLDTMDILMVD